MFVNAHHIMEEVEENKGLHTVEEEDVDPHLVEEEEEDKDPSAVSSNNHNTDNSTAPTHPAPHAPVNSIAPSNDKNSEFDGDGAISNDTTTSANTGR
jgi:hypothetical protein